MPGFLPWFAARIRSLILVGFSTSAELLPPSDPMNDLESKPTYLGLPIFSGDTPFKFDFALFFDGEFSKLIDILLKLITYSTFRKICLLINSI